MINIKCSIWMLRILRLIPDWLGCYWPPASWGCRTLPRPQPGLTRRRDAAAAPCSAPGSRAAWTPPPDRRTLCSCRTRSNCPKHNSIESIRFLFWWHLWVWLLNMMFAHLVVRTNGKTVLVFMKANALTRSKWHYHPRADGGWSTSHCMLVRKLKCATILLSLLACTLYLV